MSNEPTNITWGHHLVDILAIGQYENGISSCNFMQIDLVHNDSRFYWSYHGMRHVDPGRTMWLWAFPVCLPAISGFDGCRMGISGTYKKLIMISWTPDLGCVWGVSEHGVCWTRKLPISHEKPWDFGKSYFLKKTLMTWCKMMVFPISSTAYPTWNPTWNPMKSHLQWRSRRQGLLQSMKNIFQAKSIERKHVWN